MVEHEFNLSSVLQHNRELVTRGIADPEYAEALNNWYIKVDSLCRSSGRPFDEVATWIPAPAKAYTSEDAGSTVDAPGYFVLRPDGAEMIYPGEE